MIRKVHIANFKSIPDLTLDLGRVTVLIGANGSGKSKIAGQPPVSLSEAFMRGYIGGLPKNF